MCVGFLPTPIHFWILPNFYLLSLGDTSLLFFLINLADRASRQSTFSIPQILQVPFLSRFLRYHPETSIVCSVDQFSRQDSLSFSRYRTSFYQHDTEITFIVCPPATMTPTVQCPKSYALVVFNGCEGSSGLAGDFVKISKSFIDKGIQPTCLSNHDMHHFMVCHEGPLLYGRSELGEKEKIFDWNEEPFYELVSSGMKQRVLEWVRDTASIIQENERMVIVIATHGMQKGHIVFETGHSRETIDVEEMYGAIRHLPKYTRLLFVNLACYASRWKSLARLGGSRDVMVEVSSKKRETSKNHISGSRRCRCSFFGHAWIQEVNKFPDGNIVQHTKRIKEEMLCIPAN